MTRSRKKTLFCSILPFFYGIVLLFTGCRTRYGEQAQNELAALYYSGNIAKSAEIAANISEAEKNYTDHEAVLWHLESGSTNFDAGNYDVSMTSLERAEKLLYQIDSYDTLNLHHPGLSGDYHGYLSDRLLLHVLKGLNYMQQGKVEDFLVEMRRMRLSQFRYLKNGISPEIKTYEANPHKGTNPPLGMIGIQRAAETNLLFQNSGAKQDFEEYNRRKRPEMSIMTNPLGFYFSALAYRWENDPDEAMIDLKLMRKMDEKNPLIRRELHSIEELLDEPFTDPGEKSYSFDLFDQNICVILGEGVPSGWKNHKNQINLPGQVPATWTLCVPDYVSFTSSKLMTAAADGQTYTAGILTDLSDVMREDYYQNRFPENARDAQSIIRNTTIANNVAKAELAAAAAISDPYARAAVMSLAAAKVQATSHAYINHSEWRRWRTIPRRYQVLNLPIPASRKFSVTVPDNNGGKSRKFNFTIAPDTNRAMVYIRTTGSDCLVKKFESME